MATKERLESTGWGRSSMKPLNDTCKSMIDVDSVISERSITSRRNAEPSLNRKNITNKSNDETKVAKTSLSLSSGPRDVLIITGDFNKNLQTMSKHSIESPLHVVKLNEPNNYQIPDDVSAAIRSSSKSVWLCLTMLLVQNSRYIQQIINIFKDRRKLSENSSQMWPIFDARLLLMDNMPQKNIPAGLKGVSWLQFEVIPDSEALTISNQLIDIHMKRQEKLQSILMEINKEPFVYIHVHLKENFKPAERLPVQYIEDASKNFMEQLLDNTTNIRQYCQKQLRSPHLKVLSSNEGCFHIQLRPCDFQAFQTLHDFVKNGIFSDMIKNHIIVSKKTFEGVVDVSLDESQNNNILFEILKYQEKVQEGRKLQRLLDTDGASSESPRSPSDQPRLSNEDQTKKKKVPTATLR